MDIFENNISEIPQISDDAHRPLAERMRPESLNDFFGQDKVVGQGTPLRKAIEADNVTSTIFWGPPGTGKTTLAKLIARLTSGQFIQFSAVTSSIKEVKEVLSKAGNYYRMSGKKTYLFIDEIHRFNKAQQDAFLPYVEKGDIILLGATTENPSFEVNSALLSRLTVLVLHRLEPEFLIALLQRAVVDKERGLGDKNLQIDNDSLFKIAEAADGDGRRALSILESVASYVGDNAQVTAETITALISKAFLQYDKQGEEHYNLISALHKTIRGGDPDAALYWLARMLESGEEPLYIIRRLIRFASEDIGLADSFALTLAVSTRDSYHFLGSPEGDLAIAQLVLYLACAPKSNKVYEAFKAAKSDVQQFGSLPVPLAIRNAPTGLMKDLGYGDGYKYAHEYENQMTDMEYFPERLKGRKYYKPTINGKEKKITEYLEKYRQFRADADKKKK